MNYLSKIPLISLLNLIPLGKLKRVLFIALLVVFGCEEKEDVYGCTDPTACNFNSDATIFDNSCFYPEDYEDNLEEDCLSCGKQLGIHTTKEIVQCALNELRGETLKG